MADKKHIFKNTEVNDILEWWLMDYGYELIDKEDGLFLDDLQDEELSTYTTEEKVIDYFIEQMEVKMADDESHIFKKEVQILKEYSMTIK